MSKEVEIWKDIPGYEGLYQVSSLGRVKSLSREICNSKRCYISKEKILKISISNNGYFKVNLFNFGIEKTFMVHKLVAMAFLNHKPNGYELVIDHINDNKLDNRVENLQIVTQRFNTYKTQGKHSSKHKGVYWCKNRKKWKSAIRINGEKKHLGSFKCELAASYAYQKALKELL